MHDEKFTEFEGDLYKGSKVVRKAFKRHFQHITTGAQLKATLRAGEVAWPGCYTLFFYTSAGDTLSFGAVRKNLRAVLDSVKTKCDDGWRVLTVGCMCDIDPPEFGGSEIVCAHTGERIE